LLSVPSICPSSSRHNFRGIKYRRYFCSARTDSAFNGVRRGRFLKVKMQENQIFMRFCRGERPFAPTITQTRINIEFPNLIHKKPTLESFNGGGTVHLGGTIQLRKGGSEWLCSSVVVEIAQVLARIGEQNVQLRRFLMRGSLISIRFSSLQFNIYSSYAMFTSSVTLGIWMFMILGIVVLIGFVISSSVMDVNKPSSCMDTSSGASFVHKDLRNY